MDENPNPEQAIAGESAEEKLSRFESEQAQEANPEAKSLENGEPSTSEARPSELESKEASAPNPKDSDNLSTAEKEVATAQADAEKEGKELAVDEKGQPKRDDKGQFVKQDKKPVEQPLVLSKEETERFSKWLKQTQSKYGADMGKRLVRWDAIKEAEKALDSRRTEAQTKLDTAIKQFNADVAAFRQEQDSQKPTPEKYESWAAGQLKLAGDKEAEAKTAEDAGDFDKAEKLKDEAKFMKRDANTALASAEQLRKNPPATLQQQQQKFQTDQREWINKAAIDFPEFGKKDSAVQKAAAEYFKAMAAQEPAAAKLPGFIYFCAERAQLKAAADRLPGVEKELGELKTKLTELEALTNPTPSGGVSRLPSGNKTFDGMNSDEQFEALKREAAGI